MRRQALIMPKVDRELMGEPIVVGERVLRPVARLSGRVRFAGGNKGVGGGWLTIVPVRVQVQEAQEPDHSVDLPDLTTQATRKLVLTSVLVAVAALLVRLAFHGFDRRPSTPGRI